MLQSGNGSAPSDTDIFDADVTFLVAAAGNHSLEEHLNASSTIPSEGNETSSASSMVTPPSSSLDPTQSATSSPTSAPSDSKSRQAASLVYIPWSSVRREAELIAVEAFAKSAGTLRVVIMRPEQESSGAEGCGTGDPWMVQQDSRQSQVGQHWRGPRNGVEGSVLLHMSNIDLGWQHILSISHTNIIV